MELNEAKKLLNLVFSSTYNRKNFVKLISNIFGTYSRNEKQISFDENITNNFFDLGSYTDNENRSIGIFEVELNSKTTLLHARTSQRDLISKQLKLKNLNGALVGFYHKEHEEWRLSFVSYELIISNYETLKFEENFSSSKRQSFIIGPNEGTYTIKKQILPVLLSENDKKFNDIEGLFQIETVNDDFYNQYKELYLKLIDYLEDFIKKDKTIAEDFLKKDVSTSDFAKKTLGQFVFIYFLQKKGWIKDRSKPEKNFTISNLFDEKDKYGKNFFNDIMEPIFYESLSKKEPDKSIYKFLENFDFPYLNGGIFEPIRGYDWIKTNIVIPNNFFKNEDFTKEGDKGSGLLDVFDRFNFTVHENNSLEQDIAVDPEMMGKVFENLLNIKDRKSKGAFYTPRLIVQYMCQESLIHYLHKNTSDNIAEDEIQNFIKGKNFLEKNDLIKENALDLDKLLAEIKVCDPAVGSGAFPMGMLNEIVNARTYLQDFLPYKKSIYELKMHAISNSLYGVDLDPSAIEIARLRFWLSLIIEEEEPTPLPNLEHKLMQGNSLLSSYKGLEIFKNNFFDEDERRRDKISIIEEEIKFLEKEYYSNKIKNNTVIKNRLKTLSKKKSTINAFFIQKPINQNLFEENDHSEIKKLIGLLQTKISQFLLPNNNFDKNNLKKEIDEIKWDLIKNSIDDENYQINYKKELDKRVMPFFIWKLEFIDVFKNEGGFDIVLGNPPYIQLQKRISSNSNKKYGDLYEKSNYEVFEKTGDIYSLFYELGLNLTKKDGHLFYITSNKWMRANYGKKLRKLFSKKNPLKIIDLGKDIFKSATVDTNLILIQNKSNENNLYGLNLDKSKIVKNSFLLDNFKFSKISNIGSNNWVIEDEIDKEISNLIYKKSINIENAKIKINRGIVTGDNSTFIINEDLRNEFLKNDKKNAEVIKKILIGEDLRRYDSNDSKKFLLMTGYDIDITKKYPLIYDYFTSFENKKIEKIKSRSDRGKNWFNLRACTFYDLFEMDKIGWGNISYNSCFCIVEAGVYINAPANFLITEDYNIHFLVGYMNSSVFNYMFKKVGIPLGDAFEWKKQYIEKVPIPKKEDINHNLENKVVDLVKKIMKSKDKNQNEINSNKIDDLFFDFYEFNKEQKKIILKSCFRKN